MNELQRSDSSSLFYGKSYSGGNNFGQFWLAERQYVSYSVIMRMRLSNLSRMRQSLVPVSGMPGMACLPFSKLLTWISDGRCTCFNHSLGLMVEYTPPAGATWVLAPLKPFLKESKIVLADQITTFLEMILMESTYTPMISGTWYFDSFTSIFFGYEIFDIFR